MTILIYKPYNTIHSDIPDTNNASVIHTFLLDNDWICECRCIFNIFNEDKSHFYLDFYSTDKSIRYYHDTDFYFNSKKDAETGISCFKQFIANTFSPQKYHELYNKPLSAKHRKNADYLLGQISVANYQILHRHKMKF